MHSPPPSDVCVRSFPCPFHSLIKLCYTKALQQSSLVPGPEATPSSEISNLTSFTTSYQNFKNIFLGKRVSSWDIQCWSCPTAFNKHRMSPYWLISWCWYSLHCCRASLVAQTVKNPPARMHGFWWLIHVDVWWKTTELCKATILQLKKNRLKKKQFKIYTQSNNLRIILRKLGSNTFCMMLLFCVLCTTYCFVCDFKN